MVYASLMPTGWVRFPRRNIITGGSYVTAKRNKGKPRYNVNSLSKRFLEMTDLYRVFAAGWDGLDFSDQSKLEMFNSESYGTPVNPKNGFYVGKQWLGVNVAMWKEDRERGHLVQSELYDDPKYPHWWLDRILKN